MWEAQWTFLGMLGKRWQILGENYSPNPSAPLTPVYQPPAAPKPLPLWAPAGSYGWADKPGMAFHDGVAAQALPAWNPPWDAAE